MCGLLQASLANNLFASSCDSRRPIISFATFHLRSSSWLASAKPINLRPPHLAASFASRDVGKSSIGSAADCSKRPLLSCVGFSGTDRQKQTLCRCAIGADSFFKLPHGAKSPCSSWITQHLTKRSFFAPLRNCIPRHVCSLWLKCRLATLSKGNLRAALQFPVAD